MASDVTDVFLPADGTGHSEEIVFRPRSTNIGVPMQAIVSRDESISVSVFDDGASRYRQFFVWIAITDEDGVPFPLEGDEVEISGEKPGSIIVCKVKGRPVHDGLGMQRLDLVSHETREKSSREYRMEM